MSKDVTSKSLAEFGANDISSATQATANAPKSDWMWSSATPKLSINPLFENDKLVTHNYLGLARQENDQLTPYDEIRSG